MDEIERALALGSFFVAPSGRLRVERAVEEVPWEVFQGHLLTGGQTRELARFESWHVSHDLGETLAETPLISVRRDRERKHLHVTRQILTYGFEAYEDTPGVILSRPAQKWVAELVGTIRTDCLPTSLLAREIATYVYLAVIGVSRLPITSLESPLPAFSLGQIGYLPLLDESNRSVIDAIEFVTRALAHERPPGEQSKALEIALRAVAVEDVPRLVETLWEASRQSADNGWLRDLFLRLFHGVALSPYTQFVERLIDTLLELAKPSRLGNAAVADILGTMLRHLCRHLTAFDLVVFHNFGANYPDALFLDALLKAYLRLLNEAPGNFTELGGATWRRRRRALRQACLVRKAYEGHRVPDAPTSTGENARVLPAPLGRVPQEQITQPSHRRRTLYEGESLESLLSETARTVLDASLVELQTNSVELRELGMAHFLDRPLGACKLPSEADRTPLVASEAFSRLIAARRLGQARAAGWLSDKKHARLMELLANLSVPGLPVAELAAQSRAAVVSLADAAKAAPDFILIRSTPGSLAELWAHYDWQPWALAEPQAAASLATDEPTLLVSSPPTATSRGQAQLRLLDRQANPRLELGFGPFTGERQPLYVERGGIELVERLQILRYWPQPGVACDVSQRSLWIDLRNR